jgi:methyl-accepting chemotaxis protein
MELISKNLTRLVGITMLLTVIITTVFLGGSKVLENKLVTHEEYSKAYTELINLLALTQEMRRREKDFFLRKNIIYAKQYEKLFNEASDHIKEIQALSAGKVFAADLTTLNELLQKHSKTFVFAVRTQDEIGFDLDKGLQGKMRDYIHNLEDILVYQIKDKQLTILLFTLRRNEKNFLLKMQSAPDQPTPEVAKEFQAYLNKMTINPSLKKDAVENLNKYLDAFKQLVADEFALRKASTELTAIFTDFETIHYKLLNKSRDNAKTSYASAMHCLQIVQLLVCVLAIIMLLFVGISGSRLRKTLGKQ